MKHWKIWIISITAFAVIVGTVLIIPFTRGLVGICFYKMSQYSISEKLFSNIAQYEQYEMRSRALNYLQNGQYGNAAEIFEKLDDFDHSDLDYDYCRAKLLEYDLLYEEAIDVFDALGDFRDSDDCVIQCELERKNTYERAVKYALNGNYYSAVGIFEKLGTYMQSPNYLTYTTACRAIKNGDTEKAFDMLISLGDFENSREIATYCNARVFEKNGDYADAAKIYVTILDFHDSAARHNRCTEEYLNMTTHDEHTSFFGNMYDKARNEFAQEIYDLYNYDPYVMKYYRSAYIAGRAPQAETASES